jgi:hypothetical protein
MHSSSRARFVIDDEVGDLVKRLKRRLVNLLNMNQAPSLTNTALTKSTVED